MACFSLLALTMFMMNLNVALKTEGPSQTVKLYYLWEKSMYYLLLGIPMYLVSYDVMRVLYDLEFYFDIVTHRNFGAVCITRSHLFVASERETFCLQIGVLEPIIEVNRD